MLKKIPKEFTRWVVIKCWCVQKFCGEVTEKAYEKPEPFTPGKIEEVKFELPAVAHTFKKGHRIMIQMQSSGFRLLTETRKNL